MSNKKTVSLDQLKDKHIGKKGTTKREKYELDLSMDLIGEMIKEARKKRGLTQEELGKIVGVQKAQISKLESNVNNVTLATLLKVFRAMDAKVKLNIELGSAT